MVSKTKTQAYFISKAEQALDVLQFPRSVEDYIVSSTHIPRWLYRDLLTMGPRNAMGIRRAIVAVLRQRNGSKTPFDFIPKAC